MIETLEKVEDMIFKVRNEYVILDSDVAKLYGVETKRINEIVKRNKEKFSSNSNFILTDKESKNFLVAKCDQKTETRGGKYKNPRGFTRQGIEILSTIIRVTNKGKVTKKILDTFDSKLVLISNENIENIIYKVRGKQIILDFDLARLYQVKTGILNRQMKRNKNRFPNDFCFLLTNDEYENLKCQFGISKNITSTTRGGRRTLPYAYTEYGVSMLASVLHSDVAVEMSVKIIRAFISLRKYISTNLIEQKFITNQVMRNVEDIAKNKEDIKLLQESFKVFEEKRKVNEIYFKGQIFDAYSKIIEIFKTAKKELIIIDRYVDITLLDMIKNIKCNVILITKENNRLTNLDINRYNEQYNNLKVIYNDDYHDRYFIIDKSIIYHAGTSINHAGSRTFSINILEDKLVKEVLINNVNLLNT